MQNNEKIIIDFDVKQTKELKRELRSIREMFVTVYSEQEVNKLIKAFQKKYNAGCDGLPYSPKGSKILKGLI